MADGLIGAVAGATETPSADSKLPKEQVVDPWNVSAAEGEDKIDYDKLISQYELAAFTAVKTAEDVAIASSWL